MSILEAQNDADIDACWPVMAELRPHVPRGEFVERVRRQMGQGFRLVGLRDEDGRVVACAGFRVSENLAGGRFLHVDDLVTSSTARSRGHGRELLAWLVDVARAERCVRVDLDSGVQRHGAHRFYLREGFDIVSHHFRRTL